MAGHRRAAVPRLGPLRHPQAGAAREYSSFSLSSFFLRRRLFLFFLPSRRSGTQNKKLFSLFLLFSFLRHKKQIMLFRRPKDYQATQQPLAPAHNAQNVPAQ